jgi:hypothetical protein
MTELAIYNAPVPDRMRYAEALAGASLLPRAYQKQPANVLLALEYGAALGIAPMAAIQGIHVIEGKPTASAGLIGALVRKAGHRLRVTGDDHHAVCEIVRNDDPDFTFRAEWTMQRAQAAGLTGKGVWKQYPAAMLKARAITECARDACPEALAGVNYTAEELGQDDAAGSFPAPLPAEAPVVVERLEAVPADDDFYATPAAGDSGEAVPAAEVHDAEVVEDAPPMQSGPFVTPSGGPTAKQLALLAILLKGQTPDQARAVVSSIVGREVESKKHLTAKEASRVIDALKKAEASA